MLESLLSSQLVSYGIIIAAISYIWGRVYGTFEPYGRYFISLYTTTVVIKDDMKDLSYMLIALQNYIPKSRGRFKLSSTERSGGGMMGWTSWNEGGDENYSALVPGYGMHIIKINKKTCFLYFSKRNLENGSNKSYEETINMWMPFSHPTDINILIDEGRKIAEEFEKRTESVKIYTAQQDEWRRSNFTKTRNLDSIILPSEIKDTITEDISEFLESEKWYVDRGLPYKRGYLLSGPPGTGKTSLVSALAGEYKCPIYTISLSSVGITDASINILMKDVDKHSIILFEDIDRIKIANKVGDTSSNMKDDKMSSLTLSGLLNAIDGIDSGNGHMLFMTANFPENLDEALVRSGRVDVQLKLERPGLDMIRLFVARFFQTNADCEKTALLSKNMADKGWSIADCQSYLLKYKKSMDDAIDNLPTNK